MTRLTSFGTLEFDPQIERTLSHLRKSKWEEKEEDKVVMDMEQQLLDMNNPWALQDYDAPIAHDRFSSVVKLVVANKSEIKSLIIQMI